MYIFSIKKINSLMLIMDALVELHNIITDKTIIY